MTQLDLPEVTPSPEAQELFDQTRLRVLTVVVAKRIWDRRLTSVEKTMLGGSFRAAMEEYGNATRMWAHVKQVNLSLAVIEVAESVNLLTEADADWLRREGGELPRDPDEAMIVAIDRGDLVVDRRLQEVHWQGGELEVDWSRHPALWNFFLTVCECAKQGESFGPESFGGRRHHRYVITSKSKLGELDGFPDSITNCFETAEPGRQRLNIPAERIHLF